MHIVNLDDTIAAIATSLGESGIGIVRVSGNDALRIADEIFAAKNGRKPSSFKSHAVHYGWIVDRQKRVIDEVLLTVMRAPRTYTRQDVVEISCHGGYAAIENVLSLVLACGCRMAEPGEFTRRAFLNGRIDLAQAEAVLDIIKAKTDAALRLGVNQLGAGVSDTLNTLRSDLLDILARIEAYIDFPDDETGTFDRHGVKERVAQVMAQLTALVNSSRNGRIYREGIRVVITGRPNVGKSSLMNTLLKHDRALVTSVAGTTRDTIEELIAIEGIPITLIDTAGINKPSNAIERKAMQRARASLKAADIILFVFDGNMPLARDDMSLVRRVDAKKAIAVINKADRKQRIDKEKVKKLYPSVVEISALRGKNIAALEKMIVSRVLRGETPPPESCVVSNSRHISAIKKAEKLLAEAWNSLDNTLSVEFVAQDIKDALASLDQIIGRDFPQDVLDRIFSQFCIGK